VQITQAEIIPVELALKHPARMAHLPDIQSITAVFIRLETRQGQSAWGCAVAHPQLTGEQPAALLKACQDCAALVPDLHPTNLEYSLARLTQAAGGSKSAMCAYDLAFYDLLGLASGLPLYRLLGGYRSSMPTSATVPLGEVDESVALAQERARLGFRSLKIKGGRDPEMDVRRVQAIHRALPDLVLRLDADGGYSISSALEVARALKESLEMLEQPTPPEDLEALRQVTRQSPIPVMADQSVYSPASALVLAGQRVASGMCVKVACCGGLRSAAQVDAIARAAHMATMVSCIVEPALLTSAGLSFALSSPNVRYCDLDGYLDLVDDPSLGGFQLQDGVLFAREVPGLGCQVQLG
jgi:L-Ala-D/L-Glu epimerase